MLGVVAERVTVVKAGSYPLYGQIDPDAEADYVTPPYRIGTAVRFDTDTPIRAEGVAEGRQRGLPGHESMLAGTVTIGPGGGEDWHEHLGYYDIVLYVESGTVRIEWDGGGEDAQAGDFVRIPSRGRHRWLNRSQDDARLVWAARFYNP
jgi:quercetin dioxygenase-like cupin family protein